MNKSKVSDYKCPTYVCVCVCVRVRVRVRVRVCVRMSRFS